MARCKAEAPSPDSVVDKVPEVDVDVRLSRPISVRKGWIRAGSPGSLC
jgi:hypothetical protein